MEHSEGPQVINYLMLATFKLQINELDYHSVRFLEKNCEGRCDLVRDCYMCIKLNCSWTSSFFRPCKADIQDMEEVPTHLVQHDADCPDQYLDQGITSEKYDDIWFAFKVTFFCAIAAVMTLVVMRFLLKKRAKRRDFFNFTELQVLGLSTRTVNEA